MSDIVTSQTFVDGEKGITATKLNNIIANSVIQPSFVSAQPSTSALDPTDQLLDLKGSGAYTRITGAQLSSSVAGQLALANTSQNGMLHQTSGNLGDYCGGDNLFHVLNTFTSLTAATTLTSADTNKLLICSGGSWVLTLPAAANGLAHRLRNDMGISGTVGTITVTPPTGTIDGAATLKLLPQQECTILCDGTNWRSFGLKREVVLGVQDLSTSTASASVLLPTGYRYFDLEFAGLQSMTDNVALYAQFSTDGGATWLTAATYSWALTYTSGTAAVAAASQGVTQTVVYLGSGITSAGGVSHSKAIIHPGGGTTARPTVIALGGSYVNSASYTRAFNAYGFYNVATTINAVLYFMSTGNIANSFLTVKGIV